METNQCIILSSIVRSLGYIRTQRALAVGVSDELIKDNGHKLIRYNEAKENHEYMTVFNYSVKYGGTYDSFQYYNDYVVDITKLQ